MQLNEHHRQQVSNNIPGQIIVVENPQQQRERSLMKNTKLLNSILRDELKPVIYEEKVNEYSSNCTICLENFNNKSEIFILHCNHIFHLSCLKDWLFKNILHDTLCREIEVISPQSCC